MFTRALLIIRTQKADLQVLQSSDFLFEYAETLGELRLFDLICMCDLVVTFYLIINTKICILNMNKLDNQYNSEKLIFSIHNKLKV